MKASEKKHILGHLKKDDKEFKGQLKEDEKLKKFIKKVAKKKRK